MREILFRGLEMFKEDNVWVYGYLRIGDIAGTRTAFIIPADFDKCAIKEAPVIELTVSQYTGLKDKNGVKIFEGDIVRIGGVNYPVIFNTLGGCAEFALKDDVPFGFDYINVPMEVVGNIYENPSLLGEESE